MAIGRWRGRADQSEGDPWRPVAPMLSLRAEPLLATPAFVSIGDVHDSRGHAFLTTLELAVSVTDPPFSWRRPMVNVISVGRLTEVGLDAGSRLVVGRDEERLVLDLFPSQESRGLLLRLRGRWESISGRGATGDWSAWEDGVVRTEGWSEA